MVTLFDRLARRLSKPIPIYRNVDGAVIRHYPTTLDMPLWAGSLTIKTAIAGLRITAEEEIEVRRIGDFDPEAVGIMRSPLRPDLPPTLDPKPVEEAMASEAPIDGREIVDWMIDAAVNNIMLAAREAEYNRAGSQLSSESGDAYIPGVRVQDVQFVSERAKTIIDRGFAIGRTGRGDFRVPTRETAKKAVGVFRDILSWGSISKIGAVQWVGNLLKWVDLARTPIERAIGFFRDRAGHVAPQFIEQVPPRPQLRVNVTIELSTDTSQDVVLRFRDPTDFTNIAGERTVNVPEGTNTVTFSMTAYPYVPPLVTEIQPQDNTQASINLYRVT